VKRRSGVAAAMAAALIIALTTSGAGPAFADIVPTPDNLNITAMPEFPEMVKAFRQAHPGVSAAEAAARVNRQPSRIRLVDELAKAYPDGYGGSWYDGDTDILHLQAAQPDKANVFATLAARDGVPARVQRVRYSLAYLTEQYTLVNAHRHPALGTMAVSGGIDVHANRVVATVPGAAVAIATARTADGPITVQEQRPVAGIKALACDDHWHCGSPLRGGIGIWPNKSDWIGHDSDGFCSLGFTATASDGTHWAVTAGHCGPVQPADTDQDHSWRHGQQYLGPMRQTACPPDPAAFKPCQWGSGGQLPWSGVDVGRIRIANSYWLAGNWGWMFSDATPDMKIPVNQAATVLTDLQHSGNMVCLSSQWSGGQCGELGSVGDSDTFGLARIDHLRSCGGDSGGAVYLVVMPGVRRAVGIVSGGTANSLPGAPGCFGTDGATWFSALPNINTFFDSTSAATIRVDTR
jgi:hypothetical protein